MHTAIQALMTLAVENGASDIHLSSGRKPLLRIHGELVPVTSFPELSEIEYHQAILSLANEEQQKKILSAREFDFSATFDGATARFRTNVFFSMGKLAAVLRLIPKQIPELKNLGLPKIVNSFLSLKQGFILVTGPTGNGKSTTLASMMNEINKTRSCNIVTIEDPVEYVIEPDRATVRQREIYSDTMSFAGALRSALRQDPNVVLVGEMRDLETISAALTVAETGHLVMSTLHTNSASQTIDRIIDVFPEDSKAQVRTEFASVITAIMSQRLIPAIGGGRVACCEVMVANAAVRNAIREGKTFMIDNIMQTSIDLGMLPFEMSLARLVREGKVTEEVAMEYAIKPSELQAQLRSAKIHNT